jgi:hypothetical protein
VVVVVAIGLALWVVGGSLVNLSSGPLGDGDILVQGPPTPTHPNAGLPPLARVIIWLALIGLGALAAIRVLQPPRDSGTPTDPTDASGHTLR